METTPYQFSVVHRCSGDNVRKSRPDKVYEQLDSEKCSFVNRKKLKSLVEMQIEITKNRKSPKSFPRVGRVTLARAMSTQEAIIQHRQAPGASKQKPWTGRTHPKTRRSRHRSRSLTPRLDRKARAAEANQYSSSSMTKKLSADGCQNHCTPWQPSIIQVRCKSVPGRARIMRKMQ